MPWTSKDALRHTKQANTAKKQRQWAKVANSALERCEAKGGTTKECEASAVRQANAAVSEGGWLCPECGFLFEAKRGVLAPSVTCGECGVALELVEGNSGQEAEVMDVVVSADGVTIESVTLDGEAITLDYVREAIAEAKTRDAAVKAQQARAKQYGIAAHDPPKGNRTKSKEYAGIADSSFGDPVNYKYPADSGHARAALGYFNHADARSSGGYSASDWATVGKRLARLVSRHLDGTYIYSKGKLVAKGAESVVGETVTGEEPASPDRVWVPSSIVSFEDLDVAQQTEEAAEQISVLTTQFKQLVGNIMWRRFDLGDWRGAIRTAGEEFIRRVDRALGETAEQEAPDIAEADLEEGERFCESAVGLELAEAAVANTAARSPVTVDFVVIQPGPGNNRDRRYYPAEVLKRDAHVFEGMDIFVTEHDETERGERTKVGQLQTISGWTPEGGPIIPGIIYDPDLAEKIRNRAMSGTLQTLENSILGLGHTKKGQIDGEDWNIVEAITKGLALDLVSKAGAGGHALNLAESEGGADVSDENEQEAPTTPEGTEPEAETQTPEPEVPEGQGTDQGTEPETGAAEPEAEGTGAEESAQDTEPEAAEVLTEAQVEELVAASELPERFRYMVVGRTFESEDAVTEAITQVAHDLKVLTRSGRVFGQGPSATPSADEAAERYEEKLQEIEARHGLVLRS